MERMFFPDQKALKEETIICYIDYKGWRFNPLYSVLYLLLVSVLALFTNCWLMGHLSYPNVFFNSVPFIFAGGILFGLVALVLFTLKNEYIWAASTDVFRGCYSMGMLVQDLSVLCLHAAVCISFYARCKAGDCEDEQIPFCNPEDEIDSFPFGHGHFVLMLPLLTRVLVNNSSFGAMILSWGMSFAALVISMVKFSLDRGTHFYLGHSGLILFAIYVVEALNYERFELCLRTGVSPAEDANLDSPPKPKSINLIRAGSFSSHSSTPQAGHVCPRPLLGIPYVFVSDLLSPTRFMRESAKSLMQLVGALTALNGIKDDSKKAIATKQMQSAAIIKKMDMVLNQAYVCSSLVSMQINLAGDSIKHDLNDALRPKEQSVNLSNVLMDCITVAKAMQKIVNVNVLAVPKGDMISSIAGDTDWVSESLHCMICNAIRMSSANGTVNIVIDIIDEPAGNKNDGRMEKVSDIESGRGKTRKVLRIMVDTDAGTAVKNGMSHPVDVMSPWVEFMNKESDGRTLATREGTPKAADKAGKPELRTMRSGTLIANPAGGKKCPNGAAGLCMRAVGYRADAMNGSYDVKLGRIPHKKTKPIERTPSMKLDYNNQLSVSGGCYFIFAMPYKLGTGLPSVSSKSSIKPAVSSQQTSKAKIVPDGPPSNRERRSDEQTERGRGGERDDRKRVASNSPVREGEPVRGREGAERVNPNRERGRSQDRAPRRDRGHSKEREKSRQQPSKFEVAPSKMVMQVARKFDRRGNYDLSDSGESDDDSIDLDVARQRQRQHTPPLQHQHQHQRPPIDDRAREKRSHDQYSPPRERQAHNASRSFHERSDGQREPRSSYRAVMDELNGFKRNSNNFGSHQQMKNSNSSHTNHNSEHHTMSMNSSHHSFFKSPSSLEEVAAVDEAILMLTKAKEKLTHGHSSPEKADISPFAIPYKINQKQSVLIIIPGNIADSRDAASSIITGLKEAGKDVQMENNFVYALNMLLSGASFDAIVMDISQCNTFEATEFIRRLRAWEKTLAKQGGKETHQFVAAITLDDMVISADNELHSGVDTILAPPVKVTAIMDILNIIKILSVN